MTKRTLEELKAMRDELKASIEIAMTTHGADSPELPLCHEALRLLEDEISLNSDQQTSGPD